MNTPEPHTSPTVVFKRRSTWGGVKLEHFRFRAGQLPEHSHREHLITMPLGGCRGEIRTAGGLRARAAGEASVCVIPSGQPFTARTEDFSENLAIYLDPALVLRAAMESGPVSREPEVIEACSPHDPVVRNVGLALLAESQSEEPGGRLYVESLSNLLAVHLLRHYTAKGAAGPAPFRGGLSGRTLRRVLSFIEENYESDLSLAELAEVGGMSTFHFAREFKRATGTTPHQYLIRLRVERAKALLTDSELPLVEVSSRSGFSHQSHFTRLFRRLTGTTPHSYRLRFQP
jgi:AraC family transcriptional regulator